MIMNERTTLYRVEAHFKNEVFGLRYTTDNLEWAKEEAENMLQHRETTPFGCVTIRKANILTDDLDELDHDYDSDVLDEDFEPKDSLIYEVKWKDHTL